jgi:hypothetical protein
VEGVEGGRDQGTTDDEASAPVAAQSAQKGVGLKGVEELGDVLG